MKIYIAGKITDNPNFKQEFEQAEIKLLEQGYSVLNPSRLPRGLGYENYMHICFAMIDVADAVCVLRNWKYSEGAKREYAYAVKNKKPVWEGLF